MTKNSYRKTLLALILFSSSIVSCQLLLAITDPTNISKSDFSNFSNSLQSSTSSNEYLTEEIINEPDFEWEISQFFPYPSPQELIRAFQVMNQRIILLEQKNQDLEQKLEKLQVTINDLGEEKRNSNTWLVALASSSIGAITSLIGFSSINKLYRKKTNKKKSRDINASEPQVNSIKSTRDEFNIKAESEKKLNELQDRLKLLEQFLETEKNLSTPKAIKITGALELSKIIKIDLSETKLVEIYNDCPQVLYSSIVPVSVTADSYRQKTQGQIFLERAGRGNYWIVATKDEKYWLLPNSKISVNIHKLKTFQFLFNCIGKDSSKNDEFTLNQPARVAILPSGQEWKLEKKGRLVFGNDSRSSQLQLQVEHINEEKE
ncbi:MAG: hypothetical protein QNJ54_22435 [Prochloraceae cyanobacterium]|nr:hypothetical protein [Prochloraceae cyanobacterium]